MKKRFGIEKPLHSRRQDDSSGHAGTARTSVRSIFISDVHLGTKDCKAMQLVSFLNQYRCEKLYLVGDIFDGWRMQKGVYWTREFNKVIRKILKYSKHGTEIIYITGNHDEFLRKYSNLIFDNIHLCNRAIHQGLQGQQFLVIHGDQFEGVARCSKFIKFIGDIGYSIIMKLNRWYNFARAHLGFDYWSFAGFLQQRLPRAKTYIAEYQKAAAHYAKKQGFDGIVCGHIHQANDVEIDAVQYFNTGDWVESCTALVEDLDGQFKIVRHPLVVKKANQVLAHDRPRSVSKLVD